MQILQGGLQNCSAPEWGPASRIRVDGGGDDGASWRLQLCFVRLAVGAVQDALFYATAVCENFAQSKGA